MVTFDAAKRGTAAARWAADPRYAALAPLDLTGVRRLVVVAAHPDDESLGAGGLIARLGAAGITTEVIVVTDGSGSHPESTTHDPARVATIRRAEALVAVAELSPHAGVTFLDIPDGRTPEFREEIRARVTAALADADGTLLVSHLAADGHRDHRTIGEICAEIADSPGCRFIEFAVWMWHWGSPKGADIPWKRMRALRLSDRERDAKAAAIAAHRSQTVGFSSEPGDERMLRPDFIDHFTADSEVFIVPDASLQRDYFEELYERKSDPWSFETRWYEKRKRAVTAAALPGETYPSALELGCSIGLMTEMLADRCETLLAVDISAAAVKQARKRLAGRPGVTVKRRDVASEFPDGTFDLIVLSEVGYYLDAPGLDALIESIGGALTEGGTLVACHWRHPVEDYPLTGDAVHATIRERSGLTAIVEHVEKDFVLEVFSKDARSVAERTGLA